MLRTYIFHISNMAWTQSVILHISVCYPLISTPDFLRVKKMQLYSIKWT